MQSSSLFVGQRVVVHSEFGTVRYVGPLKHRPTFSPTDIWACIEWDTLLKGKHNGVVEGYKYYESTTDNCSMMLIQKVDAGCKLSEALDSKYQLTQSKMNELKDLSNLYVYTTNLQKKAIEMIGMEKVLEKYGDYANLIEVALQNYKIREIDDGVLNLIPKVKYLYLESNLLYSWDQFFLLSQLPKLEFISVAYNRMKMPEHMEEQQKRGISKSIKVLTFIGMNLSWPDVMKLSWCFNEVEELWLCKNICSNISSLKEKIDINNFKCMKMINLEENNIYSWEEVDDFNVFPNLEKLVLNINKINTVSYTGGFMHLKSLSLGKNEIKKYIYINEINRFPAIEKMRFVENPINIIYGDRKCRPNIIARIKKLKSLNGSTITQIERKDSEIVYLRECYEQFKESNVPNMDDYMKDVHPRWFELVKQYGSPIEMVQQKVDVMKGNMNVNSINVCFYIDTDIKKKIAKKIPLSLTVRLLKGLCGKLFGIESSKLKLFGIDNGKMIPLDDDMKQLSFYPIKDCKEIEISRV